MTHLSQVPNLESTTDPWAWTVEAEAELWGDVLLRRTGDADMLHTLAERIAWGQDPNEKLIRVIASESIHPSRAADVVAVGSVSLPLHDNLGLAGLGWVVRPAHRGRGIGTLLLEGLTAIALDYGRHTALAHTWEPTQPPAGARTLPAITGRGAVAADDEQARFMLRHGFRLNQFDRISKLELPSQAELEAIRDRARARVAPQYETVTVFGPLPDDLVEDAALLHERMSTDVPTGGLDYEAESWDAVRLRAGEQNIEVGDREQLQTFVRHIPSGHLVGYTQLVKDRTVTAVAHQWDTLILEDHRGHGLGLLAKATNHAALAEHWPGVRRIPTGNAEENQHMLAINTELGFLPSCAVGEWIKELQG